MPTGATVARFIAEGVSETRAAAAARVTEVRVAEGDTISATHRVD